MRIPLRVYLIAFAAAAVTTRSVIATEDCTILETLRSHSGTHFSRIRGVRMEDEYDTTYVLPGAKSCKVEVIDSTYSIYKCEWFSVRGRENEPAAKKAFDTYLDSVKRCAIAPHISEIKNLVDERGVLVGQEARIEDSYPGMLGNSERYVEVIYQFWSHWWVISLEYGFYEDTAE